MVNLFLWLKHEAKLKELTGIAAKESNGCFMCLLLILGFSLAISVPQCHNCDQRVQPPSFAAVRLSEHCSNAFCSCGTPQWFADTILSAQLPVRDRISVRFVRMFQCRPNRTFCQPLSKPSWFRRMGILPLPKVLIRSIRWSKWTVPYCGKIGCHKSNTGC